jgi:hypothetical protein
MKTIFGKIQYCSSDVIGEIMSVFVTSIFLLTVVIQLFEG